MDRKKFIRNSLLGSVGLLASSKVSKGKAPTSDLTIDRTNVGYNHLPNNEIKTMKSILHKADSRGKADHGWLNSHHTFSFANYHNPERMNFGVLRVLNDDVVAPGRGFGKHPHDNMEIISIPLVGDLEHKDSMGNVTVIKEGDVQVMSAGTGIQHSEYNKNSDQEVKFLQIWMYPNQKNVTPRYDQITLDNYENKNKFLQILSPNPDDEGVWVHQNAWFHLGNFDSGMKSDYTFKSNSNGLYIFVIDGNITVNNQSLSKRDGYGVWDIDQVKVIADTDAKVLLMEVPMTM